MEYFIKCTISINTRIRSDPETSFFYSVYFLRLEPFDFSVDCTELNLIFKKGIILKNALGER